MQRSNWLKLMIISSVSSLLMSGCNKEEDKIDLRKNYLFTGQVIDQVTRVPVDAAVVRYGHRFLGENDHPVSTSIYNCLSDANGRYKLAVPKDVFDDWRRYPGPVIYAEGDHYIGSNLLSAPKGGESMDLELYYPTQLQLHVWNDTINNQIDETKLWITGDGSFWIYPGFVGIVVQGWYPWPQFSFKGRDIDTVLNIKSLWGNLSYSVGGGKSYFLGPAYFSVSVKLKPDTINFLSVSF